MYDHSSRLSVFVRGDFPNPKAAPHLCFAPFAHHCQDVLLQAKDAKMTYSPPESCHSSHAKSRKHFLSSFGQPRGEVPSFRCRCEALIAFSSVWIIAFCPLQQ